MSHPQHLPRQHPQGADAGGEHGRVALAGPVAGCTLAGAMTAATVNIGIGALIDC